VALLLPALALAASHIDDVAGDYRGFSQSNFDPRNHPVMELTVTRQDGPDFFGFVEMGAPGGARAEFKGKLLNPAGNFRGRANGVLLTGAVFEVKFDGIIQSLGDQKGLLVLASYDLFVAGTRVDQGTTRLLRSFEYPPDPCFPPDPCIPPPDITGDSSGTATSDLTGEQMTAQLDITGHDRTSIEGVLAIGSEPFRIVGTIAPNSGGADEPFRFVIIGVGDSGWVLIGGQLVPPDPVTPPDPILEGTYLQNFATGAVRLGRLRLSRSVR
jgi:hypothetical protein